MRVRPAILILPALLMTAAAAANPVPGSLQLDIDRHGGIALPVLLDGEGPFLFLLDTGAARTVVADDVAARLGSPTVAQTEVVAAGGSEVHAVVRLQSVALGGMQIESLLAPVLPRERLTAIRAGIRGVLGQDFLSKFNYTLDYRRRRLVWDEPPSCDAAGAVRMRAGEGRFAVPARVADTGPIWLIPDTGAEIPVLFRSGTVGTRDAVQGATGAGVAEPVQLPKVEVGGATLTALTGALIGRTNPDADGLLPMHRFSSVSFAAGGACMIPRT